VDRFPCVAEQSDCTSLFSALQLNVPEQVSFQDVLATRTPVLILSALHDSLSRQLRARCQLRILPEVSHVRHAMRGM
jgi:hypothetical protein